MGTITVKATFDGSTFHVIDPVNIKPDTTCLLTIEVIDEVLINAIIHRDYGIDGAKVQLEITPDKIVVKSPGKPSSPNKARRLTKFYCNLYKP